MVSDDETRDALPGKPGGEGTADGDVERYRLPRTISPIGLFFGYGAPDPRTASAEEEASAPSVPARPGRKPFGTPALRSLISLGVAVGCGLFYLVAMHLPLDPSRYEFWVFLVWLVVVYAACMLFLRGSRRNRP